MDALTHRLAAALGAVIAANDLGRGTKDAIANAREVWSEYAQRCKEQAGLDHYHGREGG